MASARLLECPECGGRLSVTGACSQCGYGHKRRTAENAVDPNYNRCSWQFASERCAYIARYFPHAPSKGNGLCWGHFDCRSDQNRGIEIVRESLAKVPIDFDYSTAGLVTATEEAYKKRVDKEAKEWRERKP